MKQLSFNTAIELAKWITSNIADPLEQEKLMYQGVRNKDSIHGKYTISVPK